jgi:hypothetical protein
VEVLTEDTLSDRDVHDYTAESASVGNHLRKDSLP